jgi:NAD(P)-dependent dehydrogenase (short-subunit alcohol dehydrogenase family)
LAAARAAAVVVNYSRSVEEAEATAGALRAAGTQAITCRADVGVEAEVGRLLETTVEEFGGVDILVNCAGTTEFIDFKDLGSLTDDIWDRIFRVNVLGAFYASRSAAPWLTKSHGAIVNVASVAATRASGSSMPYSVSKAALVQLTQCLAAALAPEVRVNAVGPGSVDTRWYRDQKGAGFEAWAAEEARRMPLRRLVMPVDVARVVVGLIDSEMVTGEFVIVDGGRHILY